VNDLLASRTWAIQLHYLRAIAARAEATSPDVWAARGAGRASGDVTIIPVMGLLTQRGGYWGMSSTAIGQRFQDAMADGSKAVVLEVDSPGGEVYGVDELASTIRAARGGKPVVAVANSVAASAAYYIASQADEVLVTPSGEVGSIGVYAVHEDWSRALDEYGVTVTLVSAGEGKTTGNMFEPLSEGARAEMQASVDRYYGMFASAVAKGRRVPVEQIRSEWKAKMYGAKDAVAVGLADGVGTLDDAVRRAGSLSQQRRAVAAAVDIEVEARRRRRQRTS
jgi:signal peptide peptidase SppA